VNNYIVTFKFNDSYSPKALGLISVSMVVESGSSICAIADAREILKPVTSAEAKSVTVEKTTSDR